MFILLTLPKSFLTWSRSNHGRSTWYKCRTLKSGILLFSDICLRNSVLRTKISINSKLNIDVFCLLSWRRIIIWRHRCLWIIMCAFTIHILCTWCNTPWTCIICCFEWLSTKCSRTRHGTRSTHLLTLNFSFHLIGWSGHAHNSRPLSSICGLKIYLSISVLYGFNKFTTTSHI